MRYGDGLSWLRLEDRRLRPGHGIPHYHIEGAGYRCSVGIAAQEVIIGSAPADVLKAAQVWARADRAALLAQWQELNE